MPGRRFGSVRKRVFISAKALTTRPDLSSGVGAAVDAALASAAIDGAEIGMVSLSTTLATNALVEGQGGRVALIYVGFRAKDVEAQGLSDGLAGDPVCVLDGGHNHDGSEAAALDETALDDFLEKHKQDVLHVYGVSARYDSEVHCILMVLERAQFRNTEAF